MKKISELGITGKKLLIEGIAFLIAGVLLLIYGPSFPELMLRLFLTFLWARELWNFCSVGLVRRRQKIHYG